MPNVRWTPPASLKARSEPLQVAVGGSGVLYTFGPSQPVFVEPELVAVARAAVITAIASSTLAVNAADQ